MAATGTDPRAVLGPSGEASVRPAVALPRSGMPLWLIAIGMVLLGVLLFSVLDARRRAASAPPVKPRTVDAPGTPSPVAPLYVPPAPPVIVATPAPPPPAAAPLPSPEPRIVYVPQPAPPIAQPTPPPEPQRSADAGSPTLVFDASAPEAAAAAPGAGQDKAEANVLGTEARATVLHNRPTTVAQGTLIPAVLESALDSTRPGPARALVSSDVRSADGSRVLIPRGSRLVGEYRADLQPGQNRALVNWTRLVRPDGVAIAIGSPSADTLGRVGIKGKVNSHFFERFGTAILQSALDFGVGLGSRIGGGDSAVIVGLPGALQSSGSPLTSGSQIAPTLRVKPGAAITIFVARDLDFTGVEARQ